MTPYYADDHLTVYQGDCRAVLAELPAESVHCVVTSPPYWGLRDYGTPGQLGLEPTPEEYVANMVAVFREVRRVLRADGTVWLNLGDSYASGEVGRVDAPHKAPALAEAQRPRAERRIRQLTGLKPKDLVGIPWRVAFALQADGWYLRSDIIWAKPNPMPESVTDRPTKSHEYLFLLSRSARYFYDADAVREEFSPNTIDMRPSPNKVAYWRETAEANGMNASRLGLHDGRSAFEKRNEAGRNLRSVWTIATEPYPGAHFATFPRKLVEPCIKAGCPVGGVVLDPFAGSGTTGLVAQSLSRRAVLIDLSADYLMQAMARNAQTPLGLGA